MLSKSHLNSKNLVVVKKGLLWITGHLYGSEILSKTMTETNCYDKRCSYCSYFPGNSQGVGSCEPGTVDEKNMYIFLVMWQNSYISYKSQYCPWQIDLVDVIKLKMRSLSLNILMGSVITGPYHHRNRLERCEEGLLQSWLPDVHRS